MAPGILCIGYDVEHDNKKITRHFLKVMRKIHDEKNAPCTLFIKGKTLEKNAKHLKALKDNALFDLQQHTYSHLIFKKISMLIDNKVQEVGNDEPARKIREEIAKTSKLFHELLDIKVIGLTTPYAFYKGLEDRPDILQVLRDEGIKFVRSYGRNIKNYNPVPLEVQPYFYDKQGFPDILECPVQGWQDCIWRDRFGWKANWEREVSLALDYISEHDLYLGLAQHDWSSIKKDKNMQKTAKIIDDALERNVKIMHYQDFYKLMLKKKK
ncbi:MAG: polysaccharide deacetylase family protein [Promethearchaeota archaeon]